MTRYEEMEKQVLNFHEQHPRVWRLFCRFTFELINRGFKNYSAQHGIFARIRWETAEADIEGQNKFKINNNYSAFYARAFMAKYPQYKGFFRLRKQTSKDNSSTGLPELQPDFFPEIENDNWNKIN